jgi:hypothetical protein
MVHQTEYPSCLCNFPFRATAILLNCSSKNFWLREPGGHLIALSIASYAASPPERPIPAAYHDATPLKHETFQLVLTYYTHVQKLWQVLSVRLGNKLYGLWLELLLATTKNGR